MRISQHGLEFIEKWEGKEYDKYLDSVGLWTVGIGHLIKQGEVFSYTLTDEECYDLLRKDLIPVETALHKWVKVPTNQNQYDALCSLVFNIGTGAFLKSSVLRFLNQGWDEDAADAFLLWNKATVKGKKTALVGLTNRRRDERKLFLTT